MLTEDLLVIETAAGIEPATLPAALAQLCDGSLLGFEGLAAHQRHAWELFLYQTAAMALVRSGEAAAAEDETAWRALASERAWRQRLAALTPGCDDTAWSLVVGDPARPAFLQPPVGAGLDRHAPIGRTPDEIDLLVTAKGHDLKPARAAAGEARHWLYALVSLQTQQGYSGRGNFGIARMNGGFGSRPMLMLTPGRDLPARFRRGVQAALDARRAALDLDGGAFDEAGRALLWLEPWDSEAGLSLEGLDPLFVEVCRRVRLRRLEDGGIVALGRASEGPRVAVDKELRGDLGDAWTPVAKDGAALTVGPGGFDYRRLHSLIATDDYSEPAALRTRDDDPAELWLHAAVLVRGQGKTEGFHERWLRVPATMRDLRTAREGGGRLGQHMIADADGAKAALRIGLLTFFQGGPEKLDFKDERPRACLDQLEQLIDGRFFEHLFARLAAPDDATGKAAWRRDLVRMTRDVFETATERLSPPETRRERGRARAALAFGAQLRKAGLTAAPATEDEEEAA